MMEKTKFELPKKYHIVIEPLAPLYSKDEIKAYKDIVSSIEKTIHIKFKPRNASTKNKLEIKSSDMIHSIAETKADEINALFCSMLFPIKVSLK